MLSVVSRRRTAPSGDTKVIPQQAKSRFPSADFTTLYQGVDCHTEGVTPSR